MLKERESNFELLRIISMFLIVLYHTIWHGNTLNLSSSSSVKLILEFLVLIAIVHVNSFVLVTGYFQCKGKFKLSKIVDLILLATFYKIVILVLFSHFNIINLNKLELIKEMFPIDENYWFIRCYVFVYLLSPFLNKFIKGLKKRDYQKVLIVLTIIFSILPMMTNGLVLESNGYSLYHFCYLYIVGAYFRYYPIEIKKKDMNKFRFKLSITMVGCILTNYFINSLAIHYYDVHYILNNYIGYYHNYYLYYNNIIIIVQSVCFFLLFTTFKFNSKIINNLSKYMFGIYLIHDNVHVREFIYKFLKINGDIRYSRRYLFYVIGIACFIFLISLIIEVIRYHVTKKNKEKDKVKEMHHRLDSNLVYDKLN